MQKANAAPWTGKNGAQTFGMNGAVIWNRMTLMTILPIFGMNGMITKARDGLIFGVPGVITDKLSILSKLFKSYPASFM